MAQPVWVLSVDLQTRTATFQSGMSDAAKAARGSFNEIKAGADEMGRATGGSMMEARHGVMLLGEEFGVHLPRALTSFIASIGPVGAAMEAAFPFLAVVVGATLLLQHLAKLKQEGEQLTASQANFGHTVANVLNGLNDKLLEAGIRTDELNHNHLGALHQQLELIDHQSLAELEHSFDEVAKSADLTRAQLKTTWYQFGQGSAGAMHALDEFKRKYEELLDKKDTGGATNLLSGTLQTAQHILELQRQAADNQGQSSKGGSHQGDYAKFEQAKNDLKKQGIGYTEKEVEAQQILVDSLRAQVTVQEKVNELKAAQKTNATASTQDKIGTDNDKVAREQAQSQKIAMDEADKAWEENYRRAVAALQENEKEKIDATKQGSAARLAAIDAAIKEEDSKGLQETGFYRGLLTSRVDLTRQTATEQAKLNAEAGKESAEHTARMGELQIAAAREANQSLVAQGRVSAQEQLDNELNFAAREYDVKKQALDAEIQALDTSDKEYENKKAQLNNKLLELDAQFANQDAALMNAAQQKQVASIQALQKRIGDAYSSGFAQVLMKKESFARMMQQADSQMASSALKNALSLAASLATVQGRKHFNDARTAAADAWASAGNPILGAVEAASTFAAVMALNAGGIVPGVGNMDTVPALLTPGESVLPKKLTENLTNAAQGSNKSGPDIHVHHHARYEIHAIDGASVHQMLKDHADKFAEHATNHIRKMNR
jgi:hypothetical protein